MIKEEIKKIIGNSLEELKINFGEIKISHPDFLEHGDFTFNILPLAKENGKNPREFAEQICASIKKNLPENIEKIEIAGAGFLNFFLSKEFYKTFLSQKGVKRLKILKDIFFLAEHSDPNLFKEFHIGHIMTNTIGESIGRIAEFSGAEVKHVTFQGDVGLHVAKTIFGIKNIEEEVPKDSEDIFKKQSFLGKCYVYGEKMYSENDDFKKEIIKINKKVYSREDNEQNKIYDLGKDWSLKYFEYIYEVLGSNFDHYFLESETFNDGKRIVEENIGKVFEKSQGAIIFPGSKYKLHDRVFINSENLPTYEAKDIGLFYKKWERYNPDISMSVTDSEQKQYSQVVKKAGGMIKKE
jgi:arginyl-tRNA synthetase